MESKTTDKRDIKAEAKELLNSINKQKLDQKESDAKKEQERKEKEELTSPVAIVKYEVCSDEQAAELKRLYEEIKIKTEQLGTEHPETLDLLDAYAELNYDTKNFVLAEEYFRKAWQGRKRAQTSYIIEVRDEYGPSSNIGAVGNTLKVFAFSIFKSQYRLAKTLEEKQKFEESVELYKEALIGVEHIVQGGVYYDPYSPQVHETLEPILDGLAISLHSLGEKNKIFYKPALDVYERLFANNNELFGEMHPKSLSCVNRLAVVLRDMNRLKEAEDICVNSLATCIEVLGKDHPTTQLSVEIVAFIRHSQGKSQEAEDMFRLALACNERKFGLGHPTTLGTVVKIAILLSDQNLYDDSEFMHRRAYHGYEDYYGEDHPLTIDQVQFIGELMLRCENIPEAEEKLRRAFNARKILYGGDHPKIMDSAHCLACLIQKQTKWKHDPLIWERLKETEDLYKYSLNGRDSYYGPDGDPSIETAAALADFLFENNRLLEAEDLWKRTLEARRKKLGDLCQQTAHAAYSLGIILQMQHRFYRAIDIFALALKGYEAIYGNNKSIEGNEHKRNDKDGGDRDRDRDSDGDAIHTEDNNNKDYDEHHMITEARGAYENCLKMNAIT
jgi:hypothetical protein